MFYRLSSRYLPITQNNTKVSETQTTEFNQKNHSLEFSWHICSWSLVTWEQNNKWYAMAITNALHTRVTRSQWITAFNTDELHTHTHTHTTHTHTHLTALCPGLPRWAGTRKVKTNLDFKEARDSEWQSHQLGHMQVCTSLQTDNHASTPPLIFLQAGCPSCRPTNSVKALKAQTDELYGGKPHNWESFTSLQNNGCY